MKWEAFSHALPVLSDGSGLELRAFFPGRISLPGCLRHLGISAFGLGCVFGAWGRESGGLTLSVPGCGALAVLQELIPVPCASGSDASVLRAASPEALGGGVAGRIDIVSEGDVLRTSCRRSDCSSGWPIPGKSSAGTWLSTFANRPRHRSPCRSTSFPSNTFPMSLEPSRKDAHISIRVLSANPSSPRHEPSSVQNPTCPSRTVFAIFAATVTQCARLPTDCQAMHPAATRPSPILRRNRSRRPAPSGPARQAVRNARADAKGRTEAVAPARSPQTRSRTSTATCASPPATASTSRS